MSHAFRIFVALLVFMPFHAARALTTILADYPRYGTALSPDKELALRSAARAVAGVLLTGGSVDVAIYGNADFDNDRSKEVSVSTERARSAEATLRRMIAEEAALVGQSGRLSAVSITSTGLGTLRPVFPRPLNEEQRRANRRIEIVWNASAGPLPAPSEPIFQRCMRVLPSVSVAGTRRRMACVCSKLQQITPAVGDTHYDYRAKLQMPGSAGWPNLTPEQWNVAVNGFVRHLRADIRSSSNNSPRDADFAAGLVALDDMVGRNIDDFSNQQVGGSATGLLDRALLADIQNRMSDPNHTYSCYANYSRRDHDL
ncbi:MAG TPA: hypothetical protein VGH20_06660 [Myxococcales bacterium]|jgi:hypothetical protein